MASEKVDYVDVVKGLSDGEMSPSDLLVDRLSEDVENRFVEEALKAENGTPEVNRFNGVDVESVPSDAKEEMAGDILEKKEATAKSADEISEGVFHTVNIGGRSVFSSREKDIQNPKPKGNTDLAEAMIVGVSALKGSVKTFLANGCTFTNNGLTVIDDSKRGSVLDSQGNAQIKLPDGYSDEFTVAAWVRYYSGPYMGPSAESEWFTFMKIDSPGETRPWNLKLYAGNAQAVHQLVDKTSSSYRIDRSDYKHTETQEWVFYCLSMKKNETSLFSDIGMDVKTTTWGWGVRPDVPTTFNLTLLSNFPPPTRENRCMTSDVMIFKKALSLEDMTRVYELTKENHKYPWEVPWDLGKADPWWSRIDSEESERTEFDPLLKASIEGGHVVFRSGLVALDECEKKIHKVQEPIHDPRAFPMFKQALGQMVAGNIQIEIGGSGVECEGMKGDDAVIDTTSESFKTAVSEALERIAGEVTFQPDIIKIASESAEGEEEPTDPNKIEVESPVGSVVLDENTIRCSFADGSDSAIVRTTVSFVVADGNRSFVQDGARAEILLTIKDTREEREE